MKYILFCFGMKYYALIICWKIANVKIWPSLHEIKQSWWMLTRTKTSNILNFFKKMKIFSWLSFNFDVFFTGWLFNFCRQVLVWPRKSCMSTCISNKNLFFIFQLVTSGKVLNYGIFGMKGSNCCEVRGFCGYFHRKQNNMTYSHPQVSYRGVT